MVGLVVLQHMITKDLQSWMAMVLLHGASYILLIFTFVQTMAEMLPILVHAT
jgi:hypothetical protein